MSEIKVVKRISAVKKVTVPAPCLPQVKSETDFQLIAMGASTGGPPALQKILSGLPKDLAMPVLIVQHIASGFVEGFVDWLAGTSRLPLHIAAQGEQTLPGHCYIAPEGFHMGIGNELRNRAQQPCTRKPPAPFRFLSLSFGGGGTGAGRDWCVADRHGQRWGGGIEVDQGKGRTYPCPGRSQFGGVRHAGRSRQDWRSDPHPAATGHCRLAGHPGAKTQ